VEIYRTARQTTDDNIIMRMRFACRITKTNNTHTHTHRIHNTGLYLGLHTPKYCGPGSSVGIANEIRAGRSGIESRWGRDFPPVQTGAGVYPASCKMGTGSFPGGKVRPGRAADHSPPSSAAVMEQ